MRLRLRLRLRNARRKNVRCTPSEPPLGVQPSGCNWEFFSCEDKDKQRRGEASTTPPEHVAIACVERQGAFFAFSQQRDIDDFVTFAVNIRRAAKVDGVHSTAPINPA